MLASYGPGRRERTLIGSLCAACEEPLEHVLRGERIIQLTCSHVSHEACFYEYVKETEAATCPSCDAPLSFDANRNSNVDFGSLNKLMDSVRITESQLNSEGQGATAFSSDRQTERVLGPSLIEDIRWKTQRPSVYPPAEDVNQDGSESDSQRTASAGTETSSQNDGSGSQRSICKECEDTGSQGSSPGTGHPSTKFPIQEPTITMRSEYPYVTKSQYQQSLTCVVTVEVGNSRWPVLSSSARSSCLGPTMAVESHPETRTDRRAKNFGLESTAENIHRHAEAMKDIRDSLCVRVQNWHGLDPSTFGPLQLIGKVRVGKDRKSWQDLECYLFSEMLVCIKEKKITSDARQPPNGNDTSPPITRCVLKGSILIKKHLEQIEASPDHLMLTLKLSVPELKEFHLLFPGRAHLDTWARELRRITGVKFLPADAFDSSVVAQRSDDADVVRPVSDAERKGITSRLSAAVASPCHTTKSNESMHSCAENSKKTIPTTSVPVPLHIPIDLVMVIPLSSSINESKANTLRYSIRFLLSALGERDRMGIISFGSCAGAKVLAPLATKHSTNWLSKLDLIQAVRQISTRADVVESANAAMDMLLRRRLANPLSQILLISDTVVADADNLDLVVSRADSSNVGIHSFGLGTAHEPDALIELSNRTRAAYTYVKDWTMLRECLAGCLGSLQSISHQNAKLKITLPEGSSARFVKISGSLDPAQKADAPDVEVSLGNLRYGDKRDVLVQLAIQPDRNSACIPADHWDRLISGLSSMSPIEGEGTGAHSIEEVPLLQADLRWDNFFPGQPHTITRLSQPSLLNVTQLPGPRSRDLPSPARPRTPTTPPHPYIVQRRLELLTADMLSRALVAVDKGQPARASQMLSETRLILKRLCKGILPPPSTPPPTASLPPTPKALDSRIPSPPETAPSSGTLSPKSPSKRDSNKLGSFSPGAGIDSALIAVLDHELSVNLERATLPDVHGHDARKAVLQAVGVISSQRGFTFRTPAESFWASRIPGIKRLSERGRDWRGSGCDGLVDSH